MISIFILLQLVLEQIPSFTEDSTKSEFQDLFNGKDLSGWYTYQRYPEPTSEVSGLRKENDKYVEPIGLNTDPLHVFTVVEKDGQPAIRISGEVFGILVTDQAYENYHLTLEYKWGEKKYPPKLNNKRDSGILYHSVGKEGAVGNVWMRSIECQVQEGDTGDLFCVDSTLADVPAIKPENKSYQYEPDGKLHKFQMGSRFCKKSIDNEKPNEAWNRLDIYVFGTESMHVINGKENMHLYNISQTINGEVEPLTKGKIQIQSEGAEVFYRNIKIKQINKLPIF